MGNSDLRQELTVARARIQHLEAMVQELLAERVQLQAQLVAAYDLLEAVEDARHTAQQEVTTLKRAPFQSRRPRPADQSPKPRGRAPGHPGASRPRPTRIDQTERIAAGDTCPDCGTDFTGQGVFRTRVVEDIEIRRPTIVTQYEIERRWCPRCRIYHEAPVTAALPRHRLGWHILLFVMLGLTQLASPAVR